MCGRDNALLSESKDSQEGFVDTPLLLGAEVTNKFGESACVDRPDLFDEHSGCRAEQIDFRAERCGPRARGCGCDEHHRPRQQLVSLDDHSVTTAVLLMTSTAHGAKLIHVTPEHACSP